jgi:hypothetical protein
MTIFGELLLNDFPVIFFDLIGSVYGWVNRMSLQD